MLLLAAAIFACASVQAYGRDASGAEVQIEINIPAGSLVKALDRLGDQSGIQIMFESGVAKGVNVQALRGKFTVRAALTQLLANTGIKVDSVDDKTLVLKPGEPSASRLSPAGQMRVAMETTGAAEREAAQVENDARQVVVTDRRMKPYQSSNADIPRTVDDVQPYYIFDAETIQRSGAINIESFLKQRLTMNTSAMSNSQHTGGNNDSWPGGLGNTSSIDLRGLGVERTLVLVNGRRPAGIVNLFAGDTIQQADLNGIPTSAIERIEILPSSASGIYGGSAMGGVVNVILKENFQGGEVRANYDNSWSSDSGRRTVSGSYGLSMEGGRTHLSFSGQWAEGTPLHLSARSNLYRRNLQIVMNRDPNWATSFAYPPLGATPNITNTMGSWGTTFTPDPLQLKSGALLSSGFTSISAGLAPDVSPAERDADLAGNAGTYNLELPDTAQYPVGLRRFLSAAPANVGATFNLRRTMNPSLEAFLGFNYQGNKSSSTFNPFSGAFWVPSSSPANPFTTAVYLRLPYEGISDSSSNSISRTFTAGLNARLPGEWVAQLDASLSQGRFTTRYFSDQFTAPPMFSTVEDSPLYDTMLYGLDMSPYATPFSHDSRQEQKSLALRGSGPLLRVPSGAVHLTFGLEHRIAHTPGYSAERVGILDEFYGRDQATTSGYIEMLAPLVKPGLVRGVHALELQLAGRAERFKLDTGTYSRHTLTSSLPTRIVFGGPSENGEPVFTTATYTSNNYTFGLKYQPVAELTLRASMATAFLPPSPNQMTPNPQPSETYVTDPQNPQLGYLLVPALSGGNLDLVPEHSRSLNAGLIWQPAIAALEGLRFNLEYYRIKQFDSVTTPRAQTIVSNEDHYVGRVTRDENGMIVLVNTTALNQFYKETEGLDLSVDYRTSLPRGELSVRAALTRALHARDQLDVVLPMYEGAGYSPAEAGVPRNKASLDLVWNHRSLAVGWSSAFIDAYKQYGAAGGRFSIDNFSGEQYDYYIQRQGAVKVSSQVYHDAFVSYGFERSGLSAGSGLASMLRTAMEGSVMTLGIRNVLDSAPPLDAYYQATFFASPYGDLRMRSYWLNLTRQF